VCRHGFNSGEYKADLSSSEDAKKLIEKILSEHKRIDIIVNSISAPVINQSFEKKTWGDFSKHLDLQLKSLVEITHHVLPKMKEQGGGKIINIGTVYVNGETPSGLSDYLTAKYALLGLTKSMAKEFGKYNITVNCVSPSFIKNNFTKQYPEKLSEIIIHQTPLGRLATEKDVAETVLFLASDVADFITGENKLQDFSSATSPALCIPASHQEPKPKIVSNDSSLSNAQALANKYIEKLLWA